MAFQTGTVNGHLELLNAVETLANANGWTTLAGTYDETTDTDGYLIMEGEGLSADRNIVVGMRAYRDTGSDWYNWELAGMRDYTPGASWGNHPGTSPSRWLPLWDDTIEYWLAVNAQRIAMIAKVSTVYVHLYTGFINTYATDAEYDYPLLIGGSGTTQNQRWSDSAVAAYWDTLVFGNDRGIIHRADDIWAPVGRNLNSDVLVWPWAAGLDLEDLHHSFGDYPLFPVVLFSHPNAGAEGVLGELDGLHYVTGSGLGTEDVISIGADDHRVAQDGNRNGRANFITLEEA